MFRSKAAPPPRFSARWRRLTVRQREVAALVVAGRSTKQIGRQLDISPLTVARHRRDIFHTLGVHSAAELCGQARLCTPVLP